MLFSKTVISSVKLQDGTEFNQTLVFEHNIREKNKYIHYLYDDKLHGCKSLDGTYLACFGTDKFGDYEQFKLYYVDGVYTGFYGKSWAGQYAQKAINEEQNPMRFWIQE